MMMLSIEYFDDEKVQQEKSREKTVFPKAKGGISKKRTTNSAKKGGLFQRIKSARLFQSAMKGAVRSVRAIEDAITVTTNHLTAKFILPLLSDDPPDEM